MNPKEFNWSSEQQVTVTNPTADDYKFQVHGKEYVVGAGRTVKMPGYMAWLYVYNIACQSAQEAGDFIHWNEEGFRQKYFDRFTVGADDLVEQVEVEPEIEDLDTEDELDNDSPEEPEVKTPKIAPMKPRSRRNGRTRKA